MITDPAAFRLLASDTRRRIIYLLRAKEMTVAQIAEELNLTPQDIYHHVRKLKDADMIEMAREERVGHIVETYYRATAELFNLAHGSSEGRKVLEEEVREALDAIGRLGFEAEIKPSVAARIVEIMSAMKGPENHHAWTEQINELPGMSPPAKQQLLEYAYLVFISDAEFEGYLGRIRDLRTVLRSTMPGPPSPARKGRSRHADATES